MNYEKKFAEQSLLNILYHTLGGYVYVVQRGVVAKKAYNQVQGSID